MKAIKTGDRVKIRPEWQDEGDSEIEFIAVDDEEKGRVTIEAQLPNMPIKPTQVVRIDMIELAD
jgi:hypothetical protein